MAATNPDRPTVDISELLRLVRTVADDIATRAAALSTEKAQALIDDALFDLVVEMRFGEIGRVGPQESLAPALDACLRECIAVLMRHHHAEERSTR